MSYNELDKGRGNKVRPKSSKGKILVPEWAQHDVDLAEKSTDTFL